MNQRMLAAARSLDVRVQWTFPTGVTIALTGADVLGFSIEEGADSPLLPGAVLSAQLTMELADGNGQWRWGGSLRGERPLVGSTAEIFLVDGDERLPCGVFVISAVSAREHGGCVRVTGCDSIAGELGAAFVDGLTYPAALEQVWDALVAQTRYGWSGTLPNGSAVIDAKPDWKDASLRRAAGWIAQAAGCFVRVNRSGALELVDCVGGAAEALGPDAYMTLDDGCDSFGPVAALQVLPVGAEEAFTCADGDGEALSIRDNPLYQAGAAGLNALAQGTLARLKGLTLNRASFRWRGDPAVGVGARIALTDTFGQTTLCTVTRQTMRFEGGFSAECACETPTRDDSGVMRAITPEGGVNAAALVGTVDGGLLAAGSVTARKIAAGAVTAEKIAAGSVSADKIAAGAITADKIAAGAVSAQSVEAVTAALGELTAGEIETDRLYAALAHVIGLAAMSISAGQLEADQLAVALARVVTLQAGTGEFDFATVQNLVAGAMSLETGCAGTVAINNLLVSSANLLNAVIGGLVLKSANGKYYTVTVGSDGALGAEEVAVSGGEIAAGVASDGRNIVETSANIENLAAGTILGQRAVLNSILTTALTAGSITASEALLASASVPALYTTTIRAIGNSLDLSANESIRMVVDSLSTEKSTVFRQEEQPAGAGNGDLWIQPSTGRTWQYSCGEESALRFALTDDGQLAYAYADGETAYPIVIDESGMLAIDADARLLVDPDDVSGVWLLVSDPADPAQALDTYSGVYINKDEIHLVSQKTTVAVPGANGEDDIARFDAEGVHAQIIEADEINSPSVVATQVAATYTPANAGELTAIAENLKNVCLTGNVTVDASALTGGTLTLRGVSGGYSLTISGGTINSAEMIGCTARIVFSGVTFATSGAAATVEASPNVLITGGALNAGTGVLATERSRVCVSSCGGVCDYAADSRGFAEVTFTGTVPGTDMPYGLAKFSDGGQIYAGARLISKPSAEPEPEKPTVQTVTLTPTLTRTYNGSWRDGYWLWQGRYGTLGLNRGCMWFDTSAFAGKTVLSASLSLKRLSGAGSGVAVAIKICGTTAAGASGTPAVGAQYASVSIAQGARKSVDVTSAVQALANGSIRGLMLYDSSTSNLSSSNNWTACYAKLYGYDSSDRPVLTVTYQ